MFRYLAVSNEAAKDEANRKRRTTNIDSPRFQYSPGPGALVLRQLHGVPACFNTAAGQT
jgi:hypothetical protein